MKKEYYLLDTHALIFWSIQTGVSDKFIRFFDKQAQDGRLIVSSISFWEIALLHKKKKIRIKDIYKWQQEILDSANLTLIEPTLTEIVDSTCLPDYHKDPFDRLLIVQANQHKAVFVTKDVYIKKYACPTFWI